MWENNIFQEKVHSLPNWIYNITLTLKRGCGTCNAQEIMACSTEQPSTEQRIKRWCCSGFCHTLGQTEHSSNINTWFLSDLLTVNMLWLNTLSANTQKHTGFGISAVLASCSSFPSCFLCSHLAQTHTHTQTHTLTLAQSLVAQCLMKFDNGWVCSVIALTHGHYLSTKLWLKHHTNHVG